MSKGRIVYSRKTNFVPSPDRVLVTTPPRDVYNKDGEPRRLPVLTEDGYLDGFAEYTTNIPEKWKFSTRQKDYGISFIEANVIGPTYLHYPFSETITQHLESGRYDVLCISAFTWTLPWAIDLARLAKANYGIREVWLGGYAVMTDEPQMQDVFDRFFWGYSESLFHQALGMEPIPSEKIVHPDLTTKASWLGRETQTGHLIFRKGCSNRCTYCADPVYEPGGDRPLSLDAVETILDDYKSKGIRSVYISNQETNLFTPIGKEVLKAIETRNLNFGMLTSFQALAAYGEDGIMRLRDSGLTFLLVGLESLNDKNLEKTQRKSRQKFMLDTLSLLERLKISVTSTYMICFEDDTEETVREAKKKIIDLGITVALFNITVPLPGTPLYDSYKEKDLITDWNWTHWTGNHLVWKHPVIAPEKAQELLAELRSEVNSPKHNPALSGLWDKNLKKVAGR